ncbi:hypothetical protein [Enterobacter sp.]|nr:hypothetical protein [Enterobacter sp.]
MLSPRYTTRLAEVPIVRARSRPYWSQ